MTLNLTQHKATPEQVEAGVVELRSDLKEKLVEALTFDELPSRREVEKRAELVDDIVAAQVLNKDIEGITEEDVKEAEVFCNMNNISFMIGGAPFLMHHLVYRLNYFGSVLFAFSKRESVEEALEDGSVVKRSVFRHIGFVEA